jgi:cobalt-zinc-cadmium efflux system outer membrane protein
MTIREQAVHVLLLATAFASAAHGQETGTRSGMAQEFLDEQAGLSLEQALARAIEREPSLRAARLDIDAARGLRTEAALRPNPTLTFERRVEPAGSDSQVSVGIQWPLDLFRRRGRVEAAERELEATGLAVSDRERLLRAEVRSRYGLAAAAVRDVSVVDGVVATAQRQWDQVRARVETGRAPPLERDLLQVDLRRFEAMRLVAVGRAEAELIELRRLLGMAPEEPLELRDTLEALVTGIGSGSLSEGWPATRPDVREADARIALADARIDQASREGRVDVSLFGIYMRMDAGFPQLGLSSVGAFERVRGQFHYVTGGAMVTLPLFDRNQGQVAAARAERSAAEARQDAVELSARVEVAAARARDVRARDAVGVYSGVLELARRNFDVVRQTFELGRTTVYDVLAEQRRFLEIEQGYTAALREAWDARVALLRAQGEIR